MKRSARRVVLGVIRMSQRSQIEWLKFGRLKNERLFTRTDQCEYYCFHIFCSFLSLRSTPSVVRPLRDNYHFLLPITKSDVVISWRKLRERAVITINNIGNSFFMASVFGLQIQGRCNGLMRMITKSAGLPNSRVIRDHLASERRHALRGRGD